MKNIAVCANFINEAHRRRIDAAAEKAGFTVAYFETNDALAEEAADFEVIFGYISPEILDMGIELCWV